MCSVLTINSLLSLGRLRWLLRLRAMFHTLRLYFIYMRNIYVGKHVKITRQWKYTLVDNNLSSQIVLLYIIYIILSPLKDVKNLT